MTTNAHVALKFARLHNWTCTKRRAFFDHCQSVGYRLDREFCGAGSALLCTIEGFEIYVWNGEKSGGDTE